jgi:predicted DNA-binding protein
MNKRGRPRKIDGEQKDRQYRLRLSEEEECNLEKLSYEYGISKAEILRRGLRMQYNLLKSARN